jgi:hypothetical protein
MSETSAQSSWSGLAAATPEDRIQAMVQAFGAISVLDEEARVGNCVVLLDQEASLDDKALQQMAGGRLRALAAMDGDAAFRVSVAYEKAEKQQPGSIGMRRVFALQAAARGLSLEEIGKIESFMPGVREMAGLAPAKTDRPIAAGDLAMADPAPKKGLFGKLFSRS